MKNFKILFITILFLISSVTTQAQFFKKLQKKAEEKIAREAEKRAERRVNKKIDKTFDKTEETIDGATESKKKTKSSNSKSSKKENLPDSYSFDWSYVMQMQTKDGLVHMIYFLKKNANYMGIKVNADKDNPAGNMVMILDTKRNVNITLMDMNGSKMKTTSKMPDITGNDDDDDSDYSLTKIDTKVILGYNCQGYKAVTKDGTSILYVATNTPVTFNQLYNNNKASKGFDANMLKQFKKGLVMEMTFTSNKKEKYNMNMRCISLKKDAFKVNLNDYKSLGF